MKNTKIQFDTSEYERSHGAKPRGRGSWAFSTTREMDYELGKEERSGRFVVGPTYVWVHQATFAEAKREAAAIARAKGWHGLYVMP